MSSQPPSDATQSISTNATSTTVDNTSGGLNTSVVPSSPVKQTTGVFGPGFEAPATSAPQSSGALGLQVALDPSPIAGSFGLNAEAPQSTSQFGVPPTSGTIQGTPQFGSLLSGSTQGTFGVRSNAPPLQPAGFGSTPAFGQTSTPRNEQVFGMQQLSFGQSGPACNAGILRPQTWVFGGVILTLTGGYLLPPNKQK